MTPTNGAAAPEVVAEAALAPEVESEVDAFQRQVDDLVSKTDVVTPFSSSPSPVPPSVEAAIRPWGKRRSECAFGGIRGNL
jgi:hypothetical protein